MIKSNTFQRFFVVVVALISTSESVEFTDCVYLIVIVCICVCVRGWG